MAAEPAGMVTPVGGSHVLRSASWAPHHAKRTVFCGWTWAICNATSRSAALPEPLSLIPGPARTESRCAPAITTLLSSPVFVSASTLNVVLISRKVLANTLIRRPEIPASWAPSA
jgi:hypothetical protein